MDAPTQFVVVFVLAAVVGGFDIAQRNRFSRIEAVKSIPAVIYMGVSGMAATGALWLVRALGWTFYLGGTQVDQSLVPLAQTLAAALGWVTIMKGAVVTWGQDGEAIPRGPYQLLEQLLTTCDQAISDELSLQKTRRARKVMNGVSFEKAWSALPALCAGITLMSGEDAACRSPRGIGQFGG